MKKSNDAIKAIKTKINIGELDEIEKFEELEKKNKKEVKQNKKEVKQTKNSISNKLKVDYIRAISYDFILLVGCANKNKKAYSYKDFKADKDKENYNNIIEGLNFDKLLKYLEKFNIYNVDGVIYDPLHYKYKFGKYPDEIENLLSKKPLTIQDIELIKRFKPEDLKKQLLKIIFNKNKNKANIIYDCLDLGAVYNFMIYDDLDFKNLILLPAEQEFKFKSNNEIVRYTQFLDGKEGITNNIINEEFEKHNNGNNAIFTEGEQCFLCCSDDIETIINYKDCKCNCNICKDCYKEGINKIDKCPICKDANINNSLCFQKPLQEIKEEFKEHYYFRGAKKIKLTSNDKGDINFIWRDKEGFKSAAIQKIDFDLKEGLIELWFEAGFEYNYVTNYLYNVNNRIKAILNDANLSMLSEGGDGEAINRLFNMYNKNNYEKKYELYKELIGELVDFKSLIFSMSNNDEDFIKERILGALEIDGEDGEKINIYYDVDKGIIYYSDKEDADLMDLFSDCEFESLIMMLF